jgi:anti-sigma regulatory factor (Ser/Thr protein kinase)
MTARFEAEVLAQPEAISALTDRVLAHLAAEGVDVRASHHVALALDELLTNLGSHGRCTDRPAQVRIAIESDSVKTEIVDSGLPFDIREAPEPTLSQNIEERPIGGLGLFLIRQFASEIGYERRDGVNTTTFAIARKTSP